MQVVTKRKAGVFFIAVVSCCSFSAISYAVLHYTLSLSFHSVVYLHSRLPNSVPIASDAYAQTIDEILSMPSNVSADRAAIERLQAAYDDAVQGFELQKVGSFCSHFGALFNVFVTRVFRCRYWRSALRSSTCKRCVTCDV